MRQEAIIQQLNEQTKTFFSDVAVYDAVTSTNNIALLKAKENSNKNYVVIADSQSAGRGRHGRTWTSPAGKNIYLSLSWHFAKPMNALTELSVTVGKCIANALKNDGISQAITIKLPNDLMHDNKKFGGILIETIPVNGTECIAVIGIGINVNIGEKDTALIDQPWTSLLQITKEEQDRNRLIAILLNALCAMLCAQ